MARKPQHTTEGGETGMLSHDGTDSRSNAQQGGDLYAHEAGDQAGEHNGAAGSNGGTGDGGTTAGTGDDGKKKPLELKRADFSRLVNNRMSNAVDAIRRLANCANKQSYEWSQEQQTEIFRTLRTVVETTEKAFIAASIPKEEGKRGANKQLSFRLSST